MVLSAKPVQRSRSLYEQTYEALRLSILSGELSPGERLIETQLAEQLQVSRTPIREAIRQLQREELITTDGAGLRVATFSVLDAVQLYDCRLALEKLAVTGACSQATPEQLQSLESCVRSAEDFAAAAELPSGRLLDLDYQFHRLIALSSGNDCLVSLLDLVFAKMALLRIQTTQHNPRVLEVRVEHRQIYQALVDRNAAAAIEAIETHLMSSKDRVVREIEALQTRV